VLRLTRGCSRRDRAVGSSCAAVRLARLSRAWRPRALRVRGPRLGARGLAAEPRSVSPTCSGTDRHIRCGHGVCMIGDMHVRTALVISWLLSACTSAAKDPAAPCSRDSDCTIATDFRMCGSCPRAYLVSVVEADPCIEDRQAPKVHCATCQGNEDCGLLVPPTGAKCEVDASGTKRCVIAHNDHDSGVQ
jgi:hypothetical protein